MKAAVLEELERIVVKEVDDPPIDDDSALLKVESVAVCGSDVRIFHHGNPRVKPPAIIGHETAGVVVKAGKNVTRVKEGDRVDEDHRPPARLIPAVQPGRDRGSSDRPIEAACGLARTRTSGYNNGLSSLATC